MLVTAQQIVEGLAHYRAQPHIMDHHGPASLEELGTFIADEFGIEKEISRSLLSNRLTNKAGTGLMDQGYIRGLRDATGKLLAHTLRVTHKGKQEFSLNGR